MLGNGVIMMKKALLCIIVAIFIAGAFAGCSAKEGDQDGNKKIVVTVFPVYDWVRVLTKGSQNFDIEYLLDNGVDLHSFQPTAKDIMDISTCDIFIYVGGESDRWVDDALKQATNKDMKVINLMEVMGDLAKEEEVKEGMQEEEHDHDHDEHDEDHDDEHGHEHEEGPEYDEHIWLSLKNADLLCKYISDALSEKDPQGEKIYRENYEAYSMQLGKLDDAAQKVVDEAPVKTLLFGDRFPFRYFTDDYGLDYYAAFVGCSAETEASFETVIFLAKKVDELGLKHICKIESSDGSIAKTIKNSTTGKDQTIVEFISMQSLPEDGETYISIMEYNIKALKEALN